MYKISKITSYGICKYINIYVDSVSSKIFIDDGKNFKYLEITAIGYSSLDYASIINNIQI